MQQELPRYQQSPDEHMACSWRCMSLSFPQKMMSWRNFSAIYQLVYETRRTAGESTGIDERINNALLNAFMIYLQLPVAFSDNSISLKTILSPRWEIPTLSKDPWLPDEFVCINSMPSTVTVISPVVERVHLKVWDALFSSCIGLACAITSLAFLPYVSKSLACSPFPG